LFGKRKKERKKSGPFEGERKNAPAFFAWGREVNIKGEDKRSYLP